MTNGFLRVQGAAFGLFTWPNGVWRRPAFFVGGWVAATFSICGEDCARLRMERRA